LNRHWLSGPFERLEAIFESEGSKHGANLSENSRLFVEVPDLAAKTAQFPAK
jgi:hypothetical protein